jgi:WD40 repeat protein/predicted Ser/Thr protein kinase
MTTNSNASLCPTCNASLSHGVCPACALDGLLRSGGNLLTEDDGSTVADEMEFGRYVLNRRLASGGMGVVYVATDQKLKRTVALKMIRGSTFADEAEVARFTIEAETAAALDHPHIVPIYEVGRREGQPFFTMKLIEGQSLAERLQQGHPLAMRSVVVLLAKIAHAVHHAHQRGVLHRDLKPGNILLDAQGEPWLTDFGLAKLSHADSSLTQTSDRLGTPQYMAPEIASGTGRSASVASDVWALGVLLWELLCGAPPFPGKGPVEIMRRIVEDEPQLPSGVRVKADLLTIARHCLEKEPQKRPASADALAEELERWLRGEPIRTRKTSWRERAFKWMRRKPAVAALYAVVTAAGLTAFLLWQRAEHAVVNLTSTNDRLETSLRIATATKLAGEARLQIDEDPSRALLLAVESVEMTEHTSLGVLPEATAALSSVLQSVGGQDVSVHGARPRQPQPYVAIRWQQQSAAFISPNNRWLVTLDFSPTRMDGVDAALFDLQKLGQADDNAGVPLQRWRLMERFDYDSYIGMLAWLPDSRHFVGIGPSGDVGCWKLMDENDSPVEPALKSLGSAFASGNYPERFYFGTSSGAELALFLMTNYADGAKTPPRPALFTKWISPAGLRDGNTRKLPFPTMANSTRMTMDGAWFALMDQAASQVHLGVETGEDYQWSTLPIPPKSLEIRLVPQHRQLLVCQDAARWSLLDLPSQGPVPERPMNDWSNNLAPEFRSSPDGNWLVRVPQIDYGRLRPEFDVFSLAGEETQRLQVRRGTTYFSKFSPQGTWLAAAGDSGEVSLWRTSELGRGGESIIFRGLPAEVYDLKFSNDEKHLIAIGSDYQVRHWAMESSVPGASPVVRSTAEPLVNHVSVSPGQRWLAASSWGVEREGQAVQGAITVASVDQSVSRKLSTPSHATGTAFSPDGKWFAATGVDPWVQVWQSEVVEKFLREGGTPPPPHHTLTMNDTRPLPRRLAFHPRGTLYASCGDGIVFYWDLNQADPGATAERLDASTLHYLLPDIAISPDGKWLAVGRHGWDPEPKPGKTQFGNMVLLYDVSKPGPPLPMTEFKAPFIEFANICFSPDSRWLTVSGAGKPCPVWDLTSPNIPASARLAPVESYLMAGVSFSADSQWLAMGGSDGQVSLWNWQTGELRPYVKASDNIMSLSFLKDGRIALGGSAAKVSIFDTDLQRLKTLARRVASRRLTDEERKKYRLGGRK